MLNIITQITSLILSILVFLVTLFPKEWETLKNRYIKKTLIIDLFAKILFISSIFLPFGIIIYFFIVTEVVDKSFIFKIFIYSLAFIFNVGAQGYFWIKKIENKANNSQEVIKIFLGEAKEKS